MVVEQAANGNRLGRDLALYTLARVVLVAALTVVLALVKVPLLVALAIALVAGFPLSLLLFRGLNQRVTAAMAERNKARYDERQRLRAQLRGEENPDEQGKGD